MKASQMLSKILESASTYQGGPLSPETCLQESPLPIQVSRPRFWSGRRYHLGSYVLRRYDLPHEHLKFKDTVVFLYISVIILGEGREHQENVSVLPICLRKKTMGWGYLHVGYIEDGQKPLIIVANCRVSPGQQYTFRGEQRSPETI